MAQRVGRGIVLLLHDGGTRRGWVVSSTPRLHFTPGKDPVPILQEAGWAPGPVWTGGKSRPHRFSIPDRPARSQSLYRLSYRARNIGTQCFRKTRVEVVTYWFVAPVARLTKVITKAQDIRSRGQKLNVKQDCNPHVRYVQSGPTSRC